MGDDNAEDMELGNYRILTQDGALWTLGKGAFGTTYKAEHKHLGGAYAMKIINDQFTDSEQVKQRFLREAKATFSLSSNKIARVHDFGVKDGVFYYVLDYCDGGNLQEYSLKNGAQPWSVVRNIALQVLEAISEAHQSGFLHRDLKPSNIMLQRPDDINSLKLIDFGMVKALEDSGIKGEDSMLTVQGSFMGNPLTASPEQLHELELDERSDLFSLGVTLWYVLCGGSPFGEAATASLVHTRLQEKEYTHELPDDLPEDGKYILGKLLNKRKEDRFATAEEVIHAIREEQTAPDKSKNDVEVAPENTQEEELDLELELIHDFSYGSYYYVSGEEGAETVAHSLYKPNSRSVPQLEQLLLESNLDGKKVIQFENQLDMDGERVYFCQPLPLVKLSDIVKSQQKLSIENFPSIYEKLAESIDHASNAGFEQLELNDEYIHVGINDLKTIPQTEEEWTEWLNAGEPEITVIPRLAPTDEGELNMKTIAGEDLAPDSVTGFASLIYRHHTGMPIKQTAFLSKETYVPSSLFSEKTNDFLREVISSSEVPASCSDMFRHLYELEVNGKGSAPEESHVSKSISMQPPAVSERFESEQREEEAQREAKEKDVKAPPTSIPESLQEEVPVTKEAAKPSQSSNSGKGKLKGLIAAALFITTGIVGYQVYQAIQDKDVDSGGKSSSQAKQDTTDASQKIADVDPEEKLRLEKLESEVLEKLSLIKEQVNEKQYVSALTNIEALDQHELKVDTSALKEEVNGLIKEQAEHDKWEQQEKAKAAERIEVQAKINALEAKRKTFVAKEKANMATTKTLDEIVVTSVRKQAEESGFKYKE
mgnify:FL=1